MKMSEINHYKKNKESRRAKAITAAIVFFSIITAIVIVIGVL